MAKGDTRCVDGRLMRHDPQFDDPDLETDRGMCPECEGAGCGGDQIPEAKAVLIWREPGVVRLQFVDDRVSLPTAEGDPTDVILTMREANDLARSLVDLLRKPWP